MGSPDRRGSEGAVLSLCKRTLCARAWPDAAAVTARILYRRRRACAVSPSKRHPECAASVRACTATACAYRLPPVSARALPVYVLASARACAARGPSVQAAACARGTASICASLCLCARARGACAGAARACVRGHGPCACVRGAATCVLAVDGTASSVFGGRCLKQPLEDS